MVKLFFCIDLKPSTFFLLLTAYDLLLYSAFAAVCVLLLDPSADSINFIFTILLIISIVWIILALTSLIIYLITEKVDEPVQKIYCFSKMLFFFIGIGGVAFAAVRLLGRHGPSRSPPLVLFYRFWCIFITL